MNTAAVKNYQLALSLGGLTGINVLVAFGIHALVLVVIGPGAETDALIAAAAIPQLLFGVIGGSLSHVLVPLLITEGNKQFRDDVWSLLAAIGVIFTGLAVLLSWSTGFWTPLLFPGLAATGTSLISDLTRIQLIGLIFNSITGVLVAVHHARQRFLWTQYCHLFDSLLAFGLLLWALPIYGIKVAAWTSVLRPLVQSLLLLPELGSLLNFHWSNRLIIGVWQRLKALLLGAAYYKSGHLVDRSLSSMVAPGGLSLFFLAYQIYAGVNDLINKVITVPMVSLLVRTAATSNSLECRKLYRQRLRWAACLTVFGYVVFLFTGKPLLAPLIGHGGVTADNIELLRWILIALGGYLVAGSMGQIIAGVFYAEGDTRTPAIVGAVGFTLGTISKFIGFLHLGLTGIAVGATLHQLFNTIVLYAFLEKKFARFRFGSKPAISEGDAGNITLKDVAKILIPCPLCTGKEFRLLAANDRYKMGLHTRSCCQCGLVMTNPVPHADVMKVFYAQHYRRYYRRTETPTVQYMQEFGLAERAEYTANYLQERNLLRDGIRILDVGCGEGSLLKNIQQRYSSIEAVGIEPSVGFAKFAMHYSGSQVYPTLDALTEDGEGEFHLIIVNHVLEHVENPVQLLSELKELIDRDGIIYVDVPDISAYGSLADLHIAHRYHFSVRTLLATAHKAGLRIVEINRHTPPKHPSSIRCLLKSQCIEPKFSNAELDDEPAHERIRAISRSTTYYHLKQHCRRVLRRLRGGRK